MYGVKNLKITMKTFQKRLEDKSQLKTFRDVVKCLKPKIERDCTRAFIPSTFDEMMLSFVG